MRGELERNLLSLENPLDFASKNNFSTLDRMPDLERDVRNLSTKLLTSDLPEEMETRIKGLRDSFSGFGRLPRPEKIKRINSALAVIRAIKGILAGMPGPEISRRARPVKKTSPKNRGAGPFASVSDIPGVGARAAGLLEKRSVRVVCDLLFYRPRKYDDRRNITDICELLPEGNYTVRGRVVSVGDIRRGRRSFFQVRLRDGTHTLALTWFNYNPRYLRGLFQKGRNFIVHGKVSQAPGRGRTLQIIHPLPQDIEIIEHEEDIGNPLQFGRIVPVYPLTEGLTQKKLRETVRGALDGYAGDFGGLDPRGHSGKARPDGLARRPRTGAFPGR